MKVLLFLVLAYGSYNLNSEHTPGNTGRYDQPPCPVYDTQTKLLMLCDGRQVNPATGVPY